MRNFFKIALAAALVASGISTARAADASDSMQVSATVVNNCLIAADDLAFGSYDPVGANKASALTGTSTVTVTCTSGATASVKLGQGANANVGSTDAAPARRMSDGGTNHLSYQLFSDSGRTTMWGNDVSSDIERTGTGVADALTIYGSVDADQNVPAGSYTDTVVATVTF